MVAYNPDKHVVYLIPQDYDDQVCLASDYIVDNFDFHSFAKKRGVELGDIVTIMMRYDEDPAFREDVDTMVSLIIDTDEDFFRDYVN